MLRPTLADVARAAGVSPASVSKALNPHADRCDLSPATKARVVAAAKALGFKPSASHSRRTRKVWRNIGLVWGRYAPFTNGAYEGVIDVIGEQLDSRGWRLLYTPVPDAAAWRVLQMSQRLDGVLAVSHVPEEVLQGFVTERYPAALLNLRCPQPLPQFLPDDRGGAAAIARHLAALGHREVLYVPHDTGPGHTSASLVWDPSPDRPHPARVGHYSEIDRLAGLTDPLPGGAALRVTSLTGRDLGEAVARVRAGTTAVVCYGWSDVPWLLTALREAGLRVPTDVSVACCNDVSWFPHLLPGVTALSIPMRELARRAVDRLLAGIAGEDDGAAITVLDEPLIARQSTGPAPKRPR